MTHNQKNILIILGIIVLILFSIIIFEYFLKTSQINLFKLAGTPSGEIDTWNTFRNDFYGIEFKYPTMNFINKNDNYLRLYSHPHGSTIYDFIIISNDNQLSPEEFLIYNLNKTLIEKINKENIISKEEVIIGPENISATKLITKLPYVIYFLIQKENTIFQFYVSPAYNDENFLNVLNKMLSTFVFIK
jgi:hypothetical protein